jgi:membrane protein DedA with SNARE-associated domain
VFGHHLTGFSAYLAVVLAGILGYQLGAIVGWWIGDRGGRPLLARHGRLLHLPPERVARAEGWFERWDDQAVLIGRITPVARSFISIPAGVFEMPFLRYNILTLIGNSVWCLALAGIGWSLGASYKSFDHGFRYVEILVVVGIVAMVAYWVMRRRRAATISSGHGDPPR